MTITMHRKGNSTDLKTWHGVLAFVISVLTVLGFAFAILTPWVRSQAEIAAKPMIKEAEARVEARVVALDVITVARDQSMRTERLLQIEKLDAKITDQAATLARIQGGIDQLIQMHMKEK
jgi:hypothetical protein